MACSRNAILLVIFLCLESLAILIGVLTHNILTAVLAGGFVALGMSAYIVATRTPVPEERVPLVVDFVY